MSDDKSFDVFLSHNGRDKEAVEYLARRLVQEAKLRPWLDKWELVPGEAWQEALEAGIGASRTCAVFLGPDGVGPWQNEEMRAALSDRVSREGFRVIPVLLPGALRPEGKELPRFLSRLTWVDFNGPEGLKDDLAFGRLVAGVRGVAPGGDGRTGPPPDPAAETSRRRRRVLLILLTAFMLTVALTIAADIVERFLSGGGDRLNIVRNFVQAPLLTIQAVLALLALSEGGRKWVERLLAGFGLNRDFRAGRWLLASAVVLALALAARLSLPSVAVYYNDRAARAVGSQPPNLTAAVYDYRRALSLNPDYAQGRYGLAVAYEGLQKYDEAIDEYDKARLLDSQFVEAHNNLARLLLKRGRDKDYENALQVLNDALSRSPRDEGLLYSLYKNRGWANYELKYYQQAENDLRVALARRNDGAAAHCLLGYVLEAQGKPDAEGEWFDCVTYAPGQETEVESRWLSHAQEKLQ
jgi:Tfp pilus assembly protein PilF